MTAVSPTLVGNFDVVIAGGGMTGAMLALQLLEQQPQLRLAIIEQYATEQHAADADALAAPKVSFDSRSIALSAASVDLLRQWGLWAELGQHACAIAQIKVSDRGHFGKANLSAAEFGRHSLGHVIEIEWLGALLYPRLQRHAERGALTWFRPARIAAIVQADAHNTLQLADGRQLESKLLVLAEGGDSPTRQLAGFVCQIEPYQQSALIANIAIASPHQHIAYERFTSTGPLALLPLSRQRYSLVWTLDPASAEAMLKLDEAAFLAQLQQAFGYSAGIFTSVGQRQLYPLSLKYCAEVARHRILLCGNSLHNLHPIAGQGFNLALRDIAAIVQLASQMSAQLQPPMPTSIPAPISTPMPTLDGFAQPAFDIGCYPLWRSYQQARQADMQQVIQLTDGMVKLFSNQSRLLALGRNLGLSALMQCQGLKQLFAEQTMGLTPLTTQQQQIQRSVNAATLNHSKLASTGLAGMLPATTGQDILDANH
jgi:2-octaprenyl-6-methoxyphenol hydroxylase